MHHGELDAETTKGLRELMRRIERHNLPPSELDKTLKIATWNIREFGKKPRQTKSLHYIAEILGQFDLIGVVELRDDVREMKTVLDILGPYWDIVYSDYIADAGGNRERVGYIFDKRACVFTGLAGNAHEQRTKQGTEYIAPESWWRKPFMASFRAGNFDFVALTTHIRWGKKESERIGELEGLAAYVKARVTGDGAIDRDVVVMGDFNIPSLDSPLFHAVAKHGLTIPTGIARSNIGSNLAKDKRYDQILYLPAHTKSVTNQGGVLDVFGDGWGDLYPEAKNWTKKQLGRLTYEMSDHLPIWAMIDTDTDAEQLDQMLDRSERKKRQR